MLSNNIALRYSLFIILSLLTIAVSQAYDWKALSKKAPAPADNPTTNDFATFASDLWQKYCYS